MTDQTSILQTRMKSCSGELGGRIRIYFRRAGRVVFYLTMAMSGWTGGFGSCAGAGFHPGSTHDDWYFCHLKPIHFHLPLFTIEIKPCRRPFPFFRPFDQTRLNWIPMYVIQFLLKYRIIFKQDGHIRPLPKFPESVFAFVDRCRSRIVFQNIV